MTDRYTVFGNPISHSLSPTIHAMFAEATDQSLVYDKICVPEPDFESFVTQHFASTENRGCNVTVPFKERAANLCEKLSDRAHLAGAANTIKPEHDLRGKVRLTGDNTDGEGLVRDLQALQIDLAARQVLVIGAGGASRGILADLLAIGPSRLVLANRTASRADELANRFAGTADIDIEARALDSLGARPFDVIINATSASLGKQGLALPAAIVSSATVAYDLMYGKTATEFMRWARDHGAAACHDGLGMLVEQAAVAFEIWREVRPDARAVLRALRQSI